MATKPRNLGDNALEWWREIVMGIKEIDGLIAEARSDIKHRPDYATALLADAKTQIERINHALTCQRYGVPYERELE